MNKKKTTLKICITMIMSVILTFLTACSSNDGNALDQDRKRVLRIAVLEGNDYYYHHLRTMYINLFAFNHRDLEIEFVSAMPPISWYYTPNDVEDRPDPIEKMKELMQGPNPPDLVFMDMNLMSALVEENLLVPLNSLIEADDFDISDFAPTVIEGLKNIGNGELYGLAPTFSSQALIYNKKIFDELHISPPTDHMYWDEILDLAKLVSQGNGSQKYFGFSFSRSFHHDLYYEAKYSFLAPLELSILNETKDRMTVDTPAWRDAWTKLYEFVQSDVLPKMEDMDLDGNFAFNYDAFLSGKLAMGIIHHSELGQIIDLNRDADFVEGYNPIDWDVVTMPMHREKPEVGSIVNMEPIVGINQSAENRDDAWEFIKFLNGRDWAEFYSQSTTEMVSRKEFIQRKGNVDYNIAAFYSLAPAPMINEMHFRGKEAELNWRLDAIGRQKFQSVLDGEKTVEEALQEWNNEGNLLLEQIKNNPDDMPIEDIPIVPLPEMRLIDKVEIIESE